MATESRWQAQNEQAKADGFRVIELDFTDISKPEKLFQPSAQQAAIYDWVENGEGNALIVAVAGAGKTTTLIESLSRMEGTVAFAAYNKRIADEIKEKVEAKGIGGNVRVGTFHSFGFQAWRRLHPSVKVDGNKIRNLMDEMNVREEWQEFIGKLVSLVRQHGPQAVDGSWDGIIAHYGLEELLMSKGTFGTLGASNADRRDFDPDDDAETLKYATLKAREVLQVSIECADKVIDFDDQLFMPLFEGLSLVKYDWVLVDEAQDSNPTRRLLAAAMLKSGGRFLAVGDPAQAIYGFTGADSESLENIRREFDCIELGLTVSYRCPQSVVNVARQWVSHIEPAADAPMGSVLSLDLESLLGELPAISRGQLEKSVVLCRKNAPLVSIAFSLIRQHVACHVEGRDIGAQIKNLARKWKTNDLNYLVGKVNELKGREVPKLMRAKKETQAEAFGDKCETLVALVEGLQDRNVNATVRDLFELCDRLFGDNVRGGLTLSSIHKAKGREWMTVYWLGANAWQPSKFAIQQWQMEQEMNLMYVAATRAQDTLVHVSVPAK